MTQRRRPANKHLSRGLRLAFPDFAGLTSDNLWRMRQFFLACRELDSWLGQELSGQADLRTTGRDWASPKAATGKVGAPTRQLAALEKVGAAPRQLPDELQSMLSARLSPLVIGLSWTNHTMIIGACSAPAERYFYMAMAVREPWSVRELRRQIDSALFLRYMSVKRDPEKCLPDDAESGELLPFKDHCAALDEQVKLAHENPSIGLVLCKTADSAQVRLALTAAARKIGVATYQTALPDEKLIQQRLRQLPALVPKEQVDGAR